jgi:FKBP-type peptidyl-prolyl cis-trans isomerase FkpA
VTLARFAAALACTAALAGCGATTTGPSSTQPFSQIDLTPGTGVAAASGDSLTVDYTGWIFDPTKADDKGLQFDTSIGRTPFVFTLGTGSVIQGWDEGLVGMKVGGIRRLVVPPSLGYGGTRNNAIPQNSTLLFEVTLISDTPAGTTATTSGGR